MSGTHKRQSKAQELLDLMGVQPLPGQDLTITEQHKDKVLDLMEEMESQVLALRALSGLLCGCSNKDSIEPNELTYLLDPIIDQEKTLIDKMRSLVA